MTHRIVQFACPCGHTNRGRIRIIGDTEIMPRCAACNQPYGTLATTTTTADCTGRRHLNAITVTSTDITTP